ncbi:MAG: transcriptional repressor [Verrucomicrobiaceae bacterium]|nr:MAG: transcriptional repressor [Verrucomicrobiaceae bacterium]
MDRSTKQKRAIEAVLQNHRKPLTAAEILSLSLREVPSIGIATVYRSLKSLSSDGQVVAVEIPGESPRYERADKGHHHHFLCRGCGEVFELEKCLEGIKKMAPAGFLVEDHEIILYGACPSCVKKRKPRRQAVCCGKY